MQIMFPLAAHLYHTEPSNLALVVLLQKGVLHRICAPIDTDPYNTKRDLVALLSHLFARRSLPRVFAGADAVEKLRPPKCPSRILLPDLSPDAKEALSEHNKQYVKHCEGETITDLELTEFWVSSRGVSRRTQSNTSALVLPTTRCH